jgi:hypothetical protein
MKQQISIEHPDLSQKKDYQEYKDTKEPSAKWFHDQTERKNSERHEVQQGLEINH